MAKARKKRATEQVTKRVTEQKTEQAEFNRLMEAMREEVAREFGLSGADSAHFADLSSRLCGKFGHTLMQRAKILSEQMEKRNEIEDKE